MNIKQKILAIEERISSLQNQSRKEEIANFLVHGIGALLSVAALAVLVVFGALRGSTWHVVGFSVFGVSLIFLYLSSALYHFFADAKYKNFFRLFDYSGIFLLIAGTYTPVLIVYFRGGWGWSLFGSVWLLAVLGIILRIVFPRNIELLLSIMYVAMGWLLLVAFKPAMSAIPEKTFVWLLIGGASYMLGLVFLSWKKLPFHHAIWHLFVLGGSVSHFFGLLLGIEG